MTLVKYLRGGSAFQAFSALDGNTPSVFFDSSSDITESSRWSILCLEPFRRLTQREGKVYINGIFIGTDYYKALKSELTTGFPCEGIPEWIPFKGGFTGFLSYEFGRSYCGVKTRFKTSCPDQAYLIDPDCLIIEDRLNQEIWLIAGGRCRSAKNQIKWLETLLQTSPHKQSSTSLPTAPIKLNATTDNIDTKIWNSAFTPSEYKEAIAAMIDHIIEGDIYVVNMSHTLTVNSTISSKRLYHALRIKNPSPYGGYLHLGKTEIACASPEQFMQVRKRGVRTKPIKGTRPRSGIQQADDYVAIELANNEKERSELLMIVDLERNDLNRVCEPGSVNVSKHYDVEIHPTVFQLVSTIEGKLRTNQNTVDLLKSTFPGGSITGAPKKRAMEIIDTVERNPRGLYTGSMLYLGFNGEMDSNILIRSAIRTEDGYEIGVGGGITYDSDSQFEYEETLQKAKAILETISEN